MPIQAFLTKPPVMDVICGGIDRCTVWLLNPPHYRPLMLECPVFGEIIDHNDLEIGHWTGEGRFSFSGKVIRKAGGELLENTWEAISATYNVPTGLDMIEAHRKLSDAFSEQLYRHPQPKRPSEHHDFFVEAQAREDFISYHMEKEGMRHAEWVLPIDLNITL